MSPRSYSSGSMVVDRTAFPAWSRPDSSASREHDISAVEDDLNGGGSPSRGSTVESELFSHIWMAWDRIYNMAGRLLPGMMAGLLSGMPGGAFAGVLAANIDRTRPGSAGASRTGTTTSSSIIAGLDEHTADNIGLILELVNLAQSKSPDMISKMPLLGQRIKEMLIIGSDSSSFIDDMNRFCRMLNMILRFAGQNGTGHRTASWLNELFLDLGELLVGVAQTGDQENLRHFMSYFGRRTGGWGLILRMNGVEAFLETVDAAIDSFEFVNLNTNIRAFETGERFDAGDLARMMAKIARLGRDEALTRLFLRIERDLTDSPPPKRRVLPRITEWTAERLVDTLPEVTLEAAKIKAAARAGLIGVYLVDPLEIMKMALERGLEYSDHIAGVNIDRNVYIRPGKPEEMYGTLVHEGVHALDDRFVRGLNREIYAYFASYLFLYKAGWIERRKFRRLFRIEDGIIRRIEIPDLFMQDDAPFNPLRVPYTEEELERIR